MPLMLYVALGHHARPTVSSGILLGVLAGLGALTRSEIALLIPGFAIVSWLAARRRRQRASPALAICVAGVLTLAPWTVYNLTRFEEPVLLSTNDGNTWWLLGVAAVRGWFVLARNRMTARWWLLVPCVAVLLTPLTFYGAHRIRAPAEPALVLVGAVAVATMLDRRRDGRLVS